MEGKEAERECKLELTSWSRFACCCLGAPPFPPFQLAQGVVEAKLYRKDVAKRHTVILGCLVCPGCWEMENTDFQENLLALTGLTTMRESGFHV